MNTLNFFTDGAYSSVRNSGGWSFYCPELHLRVCDKVSNTTNNRMELTAVLKVLEYLSESHFYEKNVTIISDSMYVIGGLTLGWKKETNKDLWDSIEFVQSLLFNLTITYKHTPGHSGVTNNEIADVLAVKASQMN